MCQGKAGVTTTRSANVNQLRDDFAIAALQAISLRGVADSHTPEQGRHFLKVSFEIR